MNRLTPVAVRQTERPSVVHLLGSPRLTLIADEKLRLFVAWWERMHRGQQKLTAVALKAVLGPKGETGWPERYVWEVCKWPRWPGFDWVFICWMIDGAGMWLKEFSTKREAQVFFRQTSTVVVRPTSTDC